MTENGSKYIDKPHWIFIRWGSLFTSGLVSVTNQRWLKCCITPRSIMSCNEILLPEHTSLIPRFYLRFAGLSEQLSQAEHGRFTWNSVLTSPSWIRARQWSWNGMDATPITEHVNPLKKLREVLMTWERQDCWALWKWAEASLRNEVHPKQ